MLHDYTDRAVVVTGGTRGIGLATGLAFGRAGAHVYLTHAWGSADEDEVRGRFAEVGAPTPAIVEADVAQDDDTQRLMELIRQEHDGVEALISNVTVVPTTDGLASLSKRALFKSLDYSTWPLVAYLKQIHKVFGRHPCYVVGTSTDGVTHYYEGYDYVALTKAVMEVLCRYLATDLLEEDVHVNVVRTRNVITESALAIHGQDYPEFIRRFGGEPHFVAADDVGQTIFALCSGLLDAMSGQIVHVDNGGPFSDNLMRLYRHREEFGL